MHIAPEALLYEYITGKRYPDSETVVVLNVEQLYQRLENVCQACGIEEKKLNILHLITVRENNQEK